MKNKDDSSDPALRVQGPTPPAWGAGGFGLGLCVREEGRNAICFTPCAVSVRQRILRGERWQCFRKARSADIRRRDGLGIVATQNGLYGIEIECPVTDNSAAGTFPANEEGWHFPLLPDTPEAIVDYEVSKDSANLV